MAEPRTLRYCINDILQLRTKPCLCVTRNVRRRLWYFGIYIRHISTIVTSRRPSINIDIQEDVLRQRIIIPIPLQGNRRRPRRSSYKRQYPRILLTNARSFSNKVDEFSIILSEKKPDICAITESWLDLDLPDSAIAVPEYSIIRRDRDGQMGGGILCYIRSNYSYSIIDDISLPILNSRTEFLVFYVEDLTTLLIVIYHPHWNDSRANEEAITFITSAIDLVLIKFGDYINIVLCGDFNGLREHFDTISALTQLKPMVDSPTRGSHILDQLFSNFATNHRPTYLPPLGRSDHCIVFWTPSRPQPPTVRKCVTRKLSASKMARFASLIYDMDWLSFVQSFNDLDEATESFQKVIASYFDICFPTRTVRLRSDDPGWMRPSLKVLINDRDRAYNLKQWAKYIRLRNEVCSHVELLKKSYINGAFSSKCPRKLWSSLKQVSRYSKNSTTSNFTADEFNDYFSSMFQSCDVPLHDLEEATGSVPTITCHEVYDFLRKLSNCSSGPDGIPPWVMRRFADLFSPALTWIFNWSLQNGRIPRCFKSANVKPIPKKNNATVVSDFRPISHLPVLSKVMERIVSRKFILPNITKSISINQFAFIPRPGTGTTNALVLAQDKVLRFLDSNSGCVRLLSVDLSKAFDKIPHNVIVNACVTLGLPAFVIFWIRDFLHERRQRISLDGVFSPWASIISGVPQGSVLGPLLFSMAINEFSTMHVNSSLILYADDILIFHSLRSTDQDRLQDEWNHLVSWFGSLFLPLNVNKCCVMDIITKSNFSTKPVRVDDDTLLQQVSDFSFLGVQLSKNLKWNIHINNVIKKASKRLFVLRNLRRASCPPDLMIRCYEAFVRSLLLYSFPSFCNLPECLIKKLVSVERRAYRIMGIPIPSNSLMVAASKMCNKLFVKLSKCSTHPLRVMFSTPINRNRRCLRSLNPPFARTRRFSKSFIRFCR